MDILTQGLLGGVLAQTVAHKSETRLASFIGVFAGLLADADILIRSADDPLLNIEYHRHFSHSLLFIPLGAAIALILLWPFVHRHISTPRLYLFCLLGYSLSGVLDAGTSYGTHLLWPFTDSRTAWNIISIIDPIFTLILLVSFISGLKLKLRRTAVIGLAVASAYMLLGFMQLQRATYHINELILSRGHSVEQHVVKPSLANNILWRSVYIHNEKIYVDAVRVSLLGKVDLYEGRSVKQFTLSKVFPDLDINSTLYKDIKRFVSFSNGFVAFKPDHDDVLGDLRYSMLPISIKPLWGIVINTEHPGVHADYRFYRENNECVRKTFINMLVAEQNVGEC